MTGVALHLRLRRPRRCGTAAIATAAHTIATGELVVLPTDTVYGIGADAFDADAVAGLLAAKGRGRDMPVPGAGRFLGHDRRAGRRRSPTARAT